MEKHTFGKEYGFQTRAVHTGNDVDAETGCDQAPNHHGEQLCSAL